MCHYHLALFLFFIYMNSGSLQAASALDCRAFSSAPLPQNSVLLLTHLATGFLADPGEDGQDLPVRRASTGKSISHPVTVGRDITQLT